mmetsp:Transcript_2450/g.9227  ORF Transcript_2450/g.9227 Transcript_2450/m.9227 type:complete len:1003 (-) Transcript_2450:2621-5629(-)
MNDEVNSMLTLQGHSNFVRCMTVLLDGRLASGSGDYSILIWDTSNGICPRILNGHTSFVHYLFVLPGGRLASGSSDSIIKTWSIADTNWNALFRSVSSSSDQQGLSSHPDESAPTTSCQSSQIDTEEEIGLHDSPSAMIVALTAQLSRFASQDKSVESFTDMCKISSEIEAIETSIRSNSTMHRHAIGSKCHLLGTMHRHLLSRHATVLAGSPFKSVPQDTWDAFMNTVEHIDAMRKEPTPNRIHSVNVMKQRSELWVQQEEEAKLLNMKLSSLVEQYKKNRHAHCTLHEELKDCVDEKSAQDVEMLISTMQQQLEHTDDQIRELIQQIEDTQHHSQVSLARNAIELMRKQRDLFAWIFGKGLLHVKSLNADYHPEMVAHESPHGRILRTKRLSDNERCILKELTFSTHLDKMRIKNELYFLLQFQHHHHIIDVNCVFVDGNSLCMEMPHMKCNLLEWLKGSSCGQHTPEKLASMPTIQSEDDILHVLNQISDTLKFLHNQRVEHRNLMPMNILLDEEEKVKFIDFGIAIDYNRLYQTSYGTMQRDTFSRRYISPECRNGEESVQFGRDLYAFGVIIFECFADPSHTDLFDVLNVNDEATADNVIPVQSGQLKGWLRDICVKLLHADPKRRPSVLEIHQQFVQYIIEEKRTISESLMDSSVKISLIQLALRQLQSSGLSNPTYSFTNIRQEDAPFEVLQFLFSVNTLSELLSEWHVSYQGQSGVDCGGLRRNLAYVSVQCFMSERFMDKYDSGFATPCDSNPLAQEMECIGKMMARCVLQEVPLEWKLSPHVFDHLVGKNHDNCDYFLRIVRYVDSECAMHMSCALQDPDKTGMESKAVEACIQEKVCGTEHRMDNLEALKRGFFACFDEATQKQLSQLNGREMMLLVCDHPDFDRNKFVQVITQGMDSRWEQNQRYTHTKTWFLRYVGECHIDCLKHLLMLMTGWPIFRDNSELTVSPSYRTMGHTCVGNMELNCNLTSYRQFCNHLNFVLAEQVTSEFDN